MSEAAVVDNQQLHRFELHEDGGTAFMVYARTDNLLRLIHTEVPDSFQGKGVGSKLVRGVLQWAQQNKVSVIPVCPFVREYLQRHPEYLPVVDPESRWMIRATE